MKNSRFSANFSGIHLERTDNFLLERNVTSGNDYGIYLDTPRGPSPRTLSSATHGVSTHSYLRELP